MKNWKTTSSGLIAAIGAALVASDDANVKLIGEVVSVIGMVLLAFNAKDHDVTGR